MFLSECCFLTDACECNNGWDDSCSCSGSSCSYAQVNNSIPTYSVHWENMPDVKTKQSSIVAKEMLSITADVK